MILSPAYHLLLLGAAAALSPSHAAGPRSLQGDEAEGADAALSDDSPFVVYPYPFGPDVAREFTSLAAGRPGIKFSGAENDDVSSIEDATNEHDYESIIEGLTYEGMDWTTGKPAERTYAEMINLHNISSFLISHKGRLIYERYFNGNEVGNRHALFSATKSYLGLVAASLVAEGVIDEDKLVPEYVPELGADVSAGGFAEATVRQVMDMSTSIKADEDLTACDFEIAMLAAVAAVEENKTLTSLAPGCEFALDYPIADGLYTLRPEANDVLFDGQGWPGPNDLRSFLKMVEAGDGAHGERWTYSTPNTDALAWVVDSALKIHNDAADEEDKLPGTAADYFNEMIWSKIGAGDDFFITTDAAGTPGWGRGGAVAARDMLRMGEVLARSGKSADGSEVVPTAAVDDIFESTDEAREQFPDYIEEAAGDSLGDMFPEWSYRSQFRSNNGRSAYMEGFFGQFLYVDRDEDLIVVTNGIALNYPAESTDRVLALAHLSKHFADGNIPGPSGTGIEESGNVTPNDARKALGSRFVGVGTSLLGLLVVTLLAV